MPSAWASEPTAAIDERPMGEADPETKTEVDFMILDYLVCLAVARILSAAENTKEEPKDDVDWQVDSVRALRSILATDQLETALPDDLDIKLRIFTVADQLRRYTPAQPIRAREGTPRLSSIGIEFLDLCSTAASKVSETRWFDTGARFMVQAVIEEHREGNAPSDVLPKFRAWNPGDPARHSKWANVRQRYANELPSLSGMSAAHNSLSHKFPFAEFKATVLDFLFDLMTTLDTPLLIELERGQIGNLSRAETQRLKERLGLR